MKYTCAKCDPTEPHPDLDYCPKCDKQSARIAELEGAICERLELEDADADMRDSRWRNLRRVLGGGK